MIPICPHCGTILHEINYCRTGQIEFDGNIARDKWWWMQDCHISFTCPECLTPLNTKDLDELGVPAEIR